MLLTFGQISGLFEAYFFYIYCLQMAQNNLQSAVFKSGVKQTEDKGRTAQQRKTIFCF